MTVNPKQVLKEFDGSDMMVTLKDGRKEPVPLKTILVNALCFSNQEIRPTAEENMRAYQLCSELMNEDAVELKAEDVVYIKRRLLVAYPSPVIYGQVVKMIEG